MRSIKRISMKGGILALALAWLCLCLFPAHAREMADFTFLGGGYTLTGPSAWEPEVDDDLCVSIYPSESSDASLLIFAPDPDDPEALSMGSRAYTKRLVDSFTAGGENVRIIREEACTLAGHEAYSIVFSREEKGVEWIGGVYGMVAEGYAFVLYGDVPAGDVESLMPAISEAADSFRFDKAALDKVRDELKAANTL